MLKASFIDAGAPAAGAADTEAALPLSRAHAAAPIHLHVRIQRLHLHDQ